MTLRRKLLVAAMTGYAGRPSTHSYRPTGSWDRRRSSRAEERGGTLPVGQAERIATRYKKLTQATMLQVNTGSSWTMCAITADRE
ncbi:hypothetical protein ACFXDJ_03810 [Streptomyces sp. NPDC059443]|uniref:hypothetical protein n=1 Tax=unclassified Streptomyces TaxID=2593676 RepID=UPI003696172D